MLLNWLLPLRYSPLGKRRSRHPCPGRGCWCVKGSLKTGSPKRQGFSPKEKLYTNFMRLNWEQTQNIPKVSLTAHYPVSDTFFLLYFTDSTGFCVLKLDDSFKYSCCMESHFFGLYVNAGKIFFINFTPVVFRLKSIIFII